MDETIRLYDTMNKETNRSAQVLLRVLPLLQVEQQWSENIHLHPSPHLISVVRGIFIIHIAIIERNRGGSTDVHILKLACIHFSISLSVWLFFNRPLFAINLLTSSFN